MTDRSSTTESGENRLVTPRNRMLGWLLWPLCLFSTVALLTYDWRAIDTLRIPPQPTANWVGALGDLFAYYGYQLVGLAVWIIPVITLCWSVRLLMGLRIGFGRRSSWFILFICCIACLLQLVQDRAPGLSAVLDSLNLPNAGGVIGYLVMTRLLLPLLSDFGSAVLVILVAAASLICAIGLHNIANFFRMLYHWADIRRQTHASETDANLPAVSKQDAYYNSLREKADAKHQRELDKQRQRAERAAALIRLRTPEPPVESDGPETADEEPVEAEVVDEPAPVTVSPRTVAPAKPRAMTVAPANAAEETAPEETDKGPYLLPPVSLLAPLKPSSADHSDVAEMSQKLVDTLKIYEVNATLAYTVKGPVVTKYALTPEPGTRPEKFLSLQQAIKMALKAKSIRIEAPIPGEDKIGVEVPNKAPAGISFREIFESDAWKKSKAELPLLFGRRADGEELVADLATMPHMLVAGATGQGKSVCLNSLICGLLMTRTPEQLKLIMVDPKSVEFTPYAAIPHLLVPVITDNRKVVFSLHWAVAEMEKRLKMFARARVRNIYDFNHRKTFTQTDMFGEEPSAASDMPKTVPYIVIIIDEAADLIGQCGKEVNPDIQRITQKARAAGIHVILATQRPDAKIITGTIKANIPGRVAFKTSQAIDSRTILDEAGAENLIGRGDMLFRGKDNNLIRAQGAWISDEEIANVTSFIEQHSNVQFDNNFAKNLGRVKEAAIEDPFAELDKEDGKADTSAREAAAAQREMVKAEENASDFKKAVECIINTNRASTSHFQRKLGWGYNHSAKIMDMLEDAGVIGPQSGAGPRQIVMSQDELLAIFNGSAEAAAGAIADGVEALPPPDATDEPQGIDLFPSDTETTTPMENEQ